MKPSELMLTAETAITAIFEQEQEVEVPTLPLQIINDHQEFEKRVLALRKEHEMQKPTGVFF